MKSRQMYDFSKFSFVVEGKNKIVQHESMKKTQNHKSFLLRRSLTIRNVLYSKYTSRNYVYSYDNKVSRYVFPY